ncbi:MAG TPA: c-type cytochrome, partial [Polyangiaceae bacterium]|nr:c-type cytochrome [Polyangiaceae bacterium]
MRTSGGPPTRSGPSPLPTKRRARRPTPCSRARWARRWRRSTSTGPRARRSSSASPTRTCSPAPRPTRRWPSSARRTATSMVEWPRSSAAGRWPSTLPPAVSRSRSRWSAATAEPNMATGRTILRGVRGARLGKAATAALLALSGLLGAACEDASGPEASPAGTAHDRAGSAAATAPAPDLKAAEPKGDATRGEALVAQLECARCHDGTARNGAVAVAEADAPLDTKHCFSCHADILAGKLDHKPDAARWKKNVAHLVAAPSLTAIGERLEYDWIVDYLVDPHDLRPNLAATMPPLAITREQARDVATYLVSLSDGSELPELDLSEANPAHGRQLIEDKGCDSCHRLGGAPLPELAGAGEVAETRVAVMLAPDLRFARDRWSASSLVRWIRNPLSMKPDTKMPETPMTEDEAKDIAAYLLRGELAPVEPPSIP